MQNFLRGCKYPSIFGMGVPNFLGCQISCDSGYVRIIDHSPPSVIIIFHVESMEASDRHSNSFFLFLSRTLAYLKTPINDPVDEPNFSFLIPSLACVTFLGFSCYLIKRGARVPRAVS